MLTKREFTRILQAACDPDGRIRIAFADGTRVTYTAAVHKVTAGIKPATPNDAALYETCRRQVIAVFEADKRRYGRSRSNRAIFTPRQMWALDLIDDPA